MGRRKTGPYLCVRWGLHNWGDETYPTLRWCKRCHLKDDPYQISQIIKILFSKETDNARAATDRPDRHTDATG